MTLTAKISPDDFPWDDRFVYRMATRQELLGLLVNGDPRTVRTDDELFFLETALAAIGGVRSETIVADELTSDRLRLADLLFLCNVSSLTPVQAAAVNKFVERGGGLFISLGSRVNPELWNRHGKPFLPLALGVVRTAGHSNPTGQEGELASLKPALGLAPLDLSTPLLRPFTKDATALTSARFFKINLLSPAETAQPVTEILRFENGAPALVERRVGRGNVILLATSIDRDWTDLPIRPGFLPLMENVVLRLSGQSNSDIVRTTTVGVPVRIPLGHQDTRLRVSPPTGAPITLRAEGDGVDRHATFEAPDRIGVYTVSIGDHQGRFRPVPAADFVANPLSGESDPTRLSPETLAKIEQRVGPNGDSVSESVPVWPRLAAVLLVLLSLESLLTSHILPRFRPTSSPGALSGINKMEPRTGAFFDFVGERWTRLLSRFSRDRFSVGSGPKGPRTPNP